MTPSSFGNPNRNYFSRFGAVFSVIKRAMKSLLRDVYHVYKTPRLVEPEFSEIARYLDPHRDSIDVGANFGIYTYFLALRSRFVFAIEPVPENFRPLCWMIGAYRLNARPIPAAASNKCGQLRFSVRENLYCSHVEESGELLVSSITLDSLNLNPSFIKIDVEGHDAQVLEGAIETLHRAHPALLVEVSCKATWDFLHSAGYYCVNDMGTNKLFLHNHFATL